MQEVASLEPRPRLAGHGLGPAMQGLEVDPAHPGVLRQVTEPLADHLRPRHHDGRRPYRHREEGLVVDFRSDVAFPAGKRPATRGDHEPVAATEGQRRIQLQQFAPALHALHREAIGGVPLFERANG